MQVLPIERKIKKTTKKKPEVQTIVKFLLMIFFKIKSHPKIAGVFLALVLIAFFIMEILRGDLIDHIKDQLKKTPNIAYQNSINDLPEIQNDLIFQRNIFNLSGELGEQLDEVAMCVINDLYEPFHEDYEVKGIIYGGTSESSVALITDKLSGKNLFKKQGQRLSHGELLTKIDQKKIWFQNEGCPRGLSLKSLNDPNQPEAVSLAKLKTYKEAGFERDGAQVKANRQWMNKVLTNNLKQTLEDARATPNFAGGRIKGFKMVEISPGSVYEKIGLQEQDVVLSINGHDLNDAVKAIQTLNALKTSSKIYMKVLRNNEVITITMDIE